MRMPAIGGSIRVLAIAARADHTVDFDDCCLPDAHRSHSLKGKP
jgi:hypothetical protein